MNIDLFTFLTSFSDEYAEFLKYTGNKLISGRHNINWKCIKSIGSTKIPKGYKCVAIPKDKHKAGMNHAHALKTALKFIESDYIIFIDSDVAILHKNWDDIIVNELNKYDCFGGGYKQETGIISRYKNFPCANLFSFRSYILDKVDLDFRPYNDKQNNAYKYHLNDIEANFCGKEKGSILKCDIGWRLPIIIKGAGFSGKSMPEIPMGSKFRKLPFVNSKQMKVCLTKCSLHMAEWHYKNRLFASHRGAGRKQSLYSKYSKMWKDRVEFYINKIKM